MLSLDLYLRNPTEDPFFTFVRSVEAANPGHCPATWRERRLEKPHSRPSLSTPARCALGWSPPLVPGFDQGLFRVDGQGQLLSLGIGPDQSVSAETFPQSHFQPWRSSATSFQMYFFLGAGDQTQAPCMLSFLPLSYVPSLRPTSPVLVSISEILIALFLGWTSS